METMKTTDELRFDKEKAYVGTYFVNGIRYDAYQAVYCTKPITGLIWSGEKSEDFFKLNIKVPRDISDGKLQCARILMYNPWGGDRGQPAARADELDNPMKEAVLRAGWVLVEPGMRGNNCFTGTPGNADFYNYAKLPRPLADLKAAIRYLRCGENARLIPGDKERIWIAGTSSGGCASSIIGTSGDSPLFTPYLEEIGAADASDAVYGSAPSCPVMNRSNGDAAMAWVRWEHTEEAHRYNKMYIKNHSAYINSLGLRAERDAGIVKKGVLLTSDNLKSYIYEGYIKEAAVKFLNGLGGKDEIDQYLSRPSEENPWYGTEPEKRDWIRPVYDKNGRVTDIEGTYDEFWHYCASEKLYDIKKPLNMQYDRPMFAPESMFEENGICSQTLGEIIESEWASPSSYSFGKPSDYAAVYSELGQKWLTEERNMSISEEYKTLIGLQRDCVNPMYFLEDKNNKTAKRWYLRTGTVDLVTPHSNFVLLGTKLMNRGKNVDMGFVWDQAHGLTDEIEEFINFASQEDRL